MALGVAVVAVVILLAGNGDDYEITAEFQNASQLVQGNEIVVAGKPAGSIKSIELGENGLAVITFTVEDDFAPLPRGTVATVRPFSISGVANRQIALTIPPEGATQASGGEDADTEEGADADGEGEPASDDTTEPEAAGGHIPDGGRMSAAETVSAVDIDQLFNLLDDRTVRNLKKVIRGFEISYDGVGRQANRGLRYLNPFLSTSRRVFGELNRDERALEGLIVDGAQLTGALADRSTDLEQLVGNLNRFQGALAREKESLATAIAELPQFMREANTTFVNLRAALDDVDPLIDASKPVAQRLQPFFREFRGAARNAVPTIRRLDDIVLRPGPANDLVDLNRLQPAVTEAALGSGAPDCGESPNDPAELAKAADDDFTQGAFGEQICSLTNGLPSLSMLRAYTPELVGWFDDFGHSGTIDANGGMGRIGTTFNTWTLPQDQIPGILPNLFETPVSPTEQFAGLTSDQRRRCPGANERDPGDGSTPFTDAGTLNCDPTQVPPGP